MHAKELSQLYWLGREIAMYVERLDTFEKDGFFPHTAPPKGFELSDDLIASIEKENTTHMIGWH